jgi:hypothetical protein
MSLKVELSHYRSQIEIWFAQRQRAERERRERQLEEGRKWQTERAEHARRLAAGEVPMPQGWYQHPNEPPGLQRWWNGERWTEFRQQVKGTAVAVGTTAAPGAPKPSATPEWLKESAIGQVAAASVFGPMFVVLMAVGASLFAAVAGAAALCIALPIIGWFFGLPLVLMFGAVAGALWASALFLLGLAWATVAFVTFLVALVRHR